MMKTNTMRAKLYFLARCYWEPSLEADTCWSFVKRDPRDSEVIRRC